MQEIATTGVPALDIARSSIRIIRKHVDLPVRTWLVTSRYMSGATCRSIYMYLIVARILLASGHGCTGR